MTVSNERRYAIRFRVEPSSEGGMRFFYDKDVGPDSKEVDEEDLIEADSLHWQDRWDQFEEEHLYAKHPEIKRRWACTDGEHPWLREWYPWDFYVDEVNPGKEVEDFDLKIEQKKLWRTGTRSPQDDPDPDELNGLIIPPGDHILDRFPPPAEYDFDVSKYRQRYAEQQQQQMRQE